MFYARTQINYEFFSCMYYLYKCNDILCICYIALEHLLCSDMRFIHIYELAKNNNWFFFSILSYQVQRPSIHYQPINNVQQQQQQPQQQLQPAAAQHNREDPMTAPEWPQIQDNIDQQLYSPGEQKQRLYILLITYLSSQIHIIIYNILNKKKIDKLNRIYIFEYS